MFLLSEFELKFHHLTPNNLLIVCHSSITNWSELNVVFSYEVVGQAH